MFKHGNRYPKPSPRLRDMNKTIKQGNKTRLYNLIKRISTSENHKMTDFNYKISKSFW